MISVIIPAHNEAAVIERCLHALLQSAQPGELEILVACNGCTDDTAARARAFGPPVRVLEVPVASKTAALNAADAAAIGFPRFYLDADVVLDLDGVRRMAAALQSGPALLAAPELRMNFSRASWAVRAYYTLWMQLPYNRVMVGAGAYALSRAGRARFDRFPDVISDDGFVRFSFAPHERIRVAGAVSHVDPPRTLAGLVRIKTRARLGGYELRRRMPARPISEQSAGGLLGTLLRSPHLLACLPVYLLVTVWTRLRAVRQLRRLAQYRWERDDSRSAAGSAPV